MTSSNEIFDEINASGNLPSLPEILIQLLDACENTETSLPEIASIISKDPALSFKVLHMVNSAYYGLQRTFVSISDAVVYLGINSIKNLAITTSIHQVFNKKDYTAVKGFKITTFWWNSLLCATLSRRIAKKVGYSNLDESYLAGLIHDIGRLVLVANYPERHKSFLFEIEDIPNELWAEEKLLGTTHCEIGALLVESWKLNSLVAEAVRYHHAPLHEVAESFPLVKIVFLANLLHAQQSSSDKCAEAASLLLDIDYNSLDTIREGAIAEVEQVAQDLGIKIEPPPTDKLENYQPCLCTTSEETEENNSGQTRHLGDDLERLGNGAENILASHVKNMALLSGFLEELFSAKDTIALIEAFEAAVYNLFQIDNVLFFLPEKDGTILQGCASPSNKLHQSSSGLLLPLKRSASSVVTTFHSPAVSYVAPESASGNPADKQLLTLFSGSTLLLLPITSHNRCLGVIALGIPNHKPLLPKDDFHLLGVIAKQIGLSLCLAITQKEKAEEIEREKKAAISMTARKFAHEINNPLGIIANYLTTLRLKTSEDPSIQEELTVISEEIERIASMVSELDLFSNATPHRFEKVDVNNLITDVIKIFKAPLESSSGITLSFTPNPEVPPISTSAPGLKQILINLIKNSSEAIDREGSIRITTSLVTQTDNDKTSSLASPGVQICIEDSGPGIPEKVLRNLFKPFTTTKGPEHSGLGLSIVKKTVADLRGALDCQSSPHAGTSFTIRLPLTKATMQAERITEVT
jgi:HD-like signal output (HDOD) protein/signal transduction histidine kinase